MYAIVGHFTPVNIMPVIEKTAEEQRDARIVVISSSPHSACEELNVDNIHKTWIHSGDTVTGQREWLCRAIDP